MFGRVLDTGAFKSPETVLFKSHPQRPFCWAMAELTVRVPSGNDGVVPQQPLVENLLLPQLLQEKRATKLPYSLQGTLHKFLRKALSANQRPSSSSMRNTRTIENSGTS